MKTRSLVVSSCLSFVAIFLFISCQKEQSFELPSILLMIRLRIYTLGAAGSNCTGVELAGTYINGIAMNGGNTASIEVTVTRAGTYNLSTTGVAGVIFSASGSFTSTGTQTVVLTASGTPAGDGDKSFRSPA